MDKIYIVNKGFKINFSFSPDHENVIDIDLHLRNGFREVILFLYPKNLTNSRLSKTLKHFFPAFDLRWLETVSSTKILMGCYSHSLSLADAIMVSKICPTIGEHVAVLFIT